MFDLKLFLYDLYDFFVPRFCTEYMVMYDTGDKFNDLCLLDTYCDLDTFLRLDDEDIEIIPVGVMEHKHFNFFGYGWWPEMTDKILHPWGVVMENPDEFRKR